MGLIIINIINKNMYGNINEKKLTQKDMTLTCDNIR